MIIQCKQREFRIYICWGSFHNHLNSRVSWIVVSYQTLAEIMSFDSTQRIRPQRQTLEDAYGTPGMNNLENK